MQNSDTVVTSSNDFDIQRAREHFNFEEKKDKKGLEHTCYGDSKGGAHMFFDSLNLQSKKDEIITRLQPQLEIKKQSKRTSLEKFLKNKPELLNEKLNNLDKDFEKELNQKVDNEIKQLEMNAEIIAKNKKANTGSEHNYFPQNWGFEQIKAAIIHIVRDVNFPAIEVQPLEKKQPQQAESSKHKNYKRMYDSMWQIQGTYVNEEKKEITITVIMAQNDKNTIKIISAFPEYKIEHQPEPLEEEMQAENVINNKLFFFENKTRQKPEQLQKAHEEGSELLSTLNLSQ